MIMQDTKIQDLMPSDYYLIWQKLSQIPDPEIPVVSIYQLGMLRGLEFTNDDWIVSLTPSYSGCPAIEMLKQDISRVFQSLAIKNFKIKIQLHPAWTTDWILDEAKIALEKYGIAPPTSRCHHLKSNQVVCPHCHHDDVVCVSEFGSTPCKAHYKCRQCLEPFDYFKCI